MLHALILAGGSGTRFWPRSRRRRPKHLLALAGDRPLLEEAATRLRGATSAASTWVVTTAGQADAVRACLPDLPTEQIVVEPAGRDTAAALGLGARRIAARDPEAVLCAMPADHVIRPTSRFRQAIESAVRLLAARPRAVVTLGIHPSAPSTAFGYIERAEVADAPEAARREIGRLPHRAYPVRAFREKPNAETAVRYLAAGSVYWNAGIFCWRAETLLQDLARTLPDTREALELPGALGPGPGRGPEEVLEFETRYHHLKKISIDYAVLESHPEVYVVEADFQWSDVGAWSALPELFGEDQDGTTAIRGRHVPIDTARCIVDAGGGLVATVGVQDLVIVRTDDAVLVCDRRRTQDVKAVVQRLESLGAEDWL